MAVLIAELDASQASIPWESRRRVQYYLWGGCSLFPFVQVITDIQTGGVDFYKTGSSAEGKLVSASSLAAICPGYDFDANTLAQPRLIINTYHLSKQAGICIFAVLYIGVASLQIWLALRDA